MTAVTKNISLTPELSEFVDAVVESGAYSSASEVVREGLRLLKQRRLKQVRARIEEGWLAADRGELVDGEAFFQGLKRRTAAARAAQA